MTTRVILIRHGKTDYSEQYRYCGFTDVPLNGTGRSQIKRLKSELSGTPIHGFFSSNLKRAIQSAEILFPKMDIIQNPGLREMNFGRWEGLVFKDIVGSYANEHQQWMKNVVNFTVPDGESLALMNKRVLAAFNSIIDDYRGKTITIVCHGGPISAILCNLKNANLNDFWSMIPKHGTLTEVLIDSAGRTGENTNE